VTRSEIFNKSLDIQQSQQNGYIFELSNSFIILDLLASYDVPGQITAVEDLIAQGAEMQVVIRLLCLASITAGGIKGKVLENIKKEVLQVGCFLPCDHNALMVVQAYGYSYLPLLLSLSSPPLAIFLPNPLPSSAAAAASSAKYPFTSLRKSLRLLIDGNEPLDELENDISYVYSGYAPISVRLVQCVAQKGGVISNPAKSKEGATEEDGKKGKSSLLGQTQAHPIVGFKGFEDVVESIPGRTFDITQKGAAATNGVSTNLRKWLDQLRGLSSPIAGFLSSLHLERTNDDCCVFPGRLHVHRDCRPSVGGLSNTRWISHLLNDRVTKFSVRPKVSDCDDRRGERRQHD